MNIFVTFIKLYSAQEKLLSTNQVSYFLNLKKNSLIFTATLNNPHLFTTENSRGNNYSEKYCC